MKYRYVFLLGRPASGKSALYRELKQQLLDSDLALTVERADDVHKLWTRLRADDAREAAGRARLWSLHFSSGDYQITDLNLFHEILKEVNADILQIDQPNHMVVLEFSRPDNIGALQNFDSAILDHCLIIYLHVSYETSCARNAQRRPVTGRSVGDNHWVPDRAMEAIYRHDDRDALDNYLTQRGIPFAVIDNDADDKRHLRKQAADLIEAHFA